ncbi:MAG: Bax inhibitor-1/YccA family protein [Bacteroidales bacterium]|nr:Bax inhibitor-1/YccA family protein [Bacteroidales bacterium]
MNEINNFNFTQEQLVSANVQRTFMSKVFLWMAAALGITGLTSFIVAHQPQFLQLLINVETGGWSLLGWVVLLSPVVIVFVMSANVDRMKMSTMMILYILYSFLMGASLSFIFLVYTTASIMNVFFITGGTFALMGILGFTTKTDLTKFGSIMMIALFGIIIAMVVNFFIGSARIDYIISIIGVLVFTGLTAYDVQKLKRLSAQVDGINQTSGKLALFGALTLYLDFINLFLFLLRIFGNRK